MGKQAIFRKTMGLVAMFCWLLLPMLVAGQNATNSSAPTVFPTLAPTLFNETDPNATFPTSAPTLDGNFTVPPGCIDNSTTLFRAMLRASSFEPNTYVICPNTTITVGNFDSDGLCCVGGDFALMTRSRSTVLCGEDGKSENNCIFKGGNTQFFYVGSFFGDSIAQEVVVSGVTFDSSEFLSTAMSNRGDITFIDCVWKVRKSSCYHVEISRW